MRNVIFILLVSLGYAVIRYVVFGDISVLQQPSYLINKAVSISAIIFLTLSAYYYFAREKEKEDFWVKRATPAITLHIILSLALLSKGYYPKFYTDTYLNIWGEMMLIFGSASVLLMWNMHKNIRLRLFLLILLSGHLFFMGFPGWIIIDKWNGGMPPISLIGFLISAIGIIYYLAKPARKKNLIKNERHEYYEN